MKPTILATTALFSLALALPTHAAEPAAASEPAETGEEITIIATRNPVPAFDYAGSVSVIDLADIDDQLASSIADLFDAEPGLQFSGGPRRTGEIPAIRGIEGEGVVILYDGVRQSFISGHDGRFFIEPDLVARAEVVRGPSSALYGSGALGGVIALETLDAGDLLGDGETFGYRLGAGYQDVNGESRYSGALFGRSADGRLDGLAALTRRNSGDISLGNDTVLAADDAITSGLLKGSIQLTDALEIEAGWTGYDGSAEEPNNGQSVNTGDLVDKTILSSNYRGAVTYAPTNSRWIDAGLIVYAGDTSVDEAELDSDREIGRQVESIGLAFDNRSRFSLFPNAELTLTYGGEYYEDEQTGTDNETGDGSRGGVPDARSETSGLFVQAELELDTAIGAFSFIPAVRHDSFSSTSPADDLSIDDDATSAKAGLSWRPTGWSLLYANYAEAFRAPSFNELFADDLHFTIPLGPMVSASNFFVPNPDLQPEESTSWEVGAGLQFRTLIAEGDALTVKGGYYESDVDNLIDLQVDFAFTPGCFVPGAGPCNAGTSRYANVAEAMLEGWELDADYDSRHVFARATYSSITGRDTASGDYVGILSPDRLHLTAGVKAPSIDARLGARVEIADDFTRVNDPADAREGYTVTDIFVAWAPSSGLLEGLRVDAGFDNVFDAEFERTFAGVVEPGRNAKLAARWTDTF